VPKSVIVAKYFAKQQGEIYELRTALDVVTAKLAEIEEEHTVEGGALDLDSLKRAEVSARLKEIAKDVESRDEASILNSWLDLNAQETEVRKCLKDAETALDAVAYAKYPGLSESEILTLVVNDKWMATLDVRIHSEMDRASHQLAYRVKALTLRYGASLSQLEQDSAVLQVAVMQHVARMGFTLS
jgi:type I restriction enzyme M protein